MALPGPLALAVLVLTQFAAGEDLQQAQVQSTCCSQVFLSSTAGLAASAPFSLGIYTISSQRIAGNTHPVYVKHSDTGDHYLYFREKGEAKEQSRQKIIIRFALQRTIFHRAGLLGPNCWRTVSTSPL